MNENKLLLDAFAVIKNIDATAHLDGMDKLKRRIQREIATIESLKNRNELKENHVKCSNLHQLHAIHRYSSKLPNLTSILKSFHSKCNESVVVDIVGNNGLMWYKLILRDPKALHHIYASGSKKGVAPMNEVAQKYLRVGQENQLLFSNPKLSFIFERGISSSIAKELENLGVQIIGKIISDELLGGEAINSEDESGDTVLENIPFTDLNLYENTQKTACIGASIKIDHDYQSVNLDITCLISYCSDTCNGGCNLIFKDTFLNDQAQWERENPIIPILDEYFSGKNLILCKEACEHFKVILSTIGGKKEIERGTALLDRCTVVESKDVFYNQLNLGGKIKSLSRKIFGTGHFHHAPTVTSNYGFIRAAEHKGVKIAALIHGPRALTEIKGKTANPKT